MEGKAKEAFSRVYKLPFYQMDSHSWVYDDGDNFAFQFEVDNEAIQKRMLDAINGNIQLENNDLVFGYKNTEVFKINEENKPLITIRGWGRLTGIGGLNLSFEEASNIQDSLGEYIVEQLNKRSTEAAIKKAVEIFNEKYA
ncbi:hypothetical protein HZQ94_08905 [Elizabethkingia anophelis]|nr:hypothetical protein [Elizabethkingia anophelis]MCT3680143.1 hypothetical protein [Elizabethkingia anophelis]